MADEKKSKVSYDGKTYKKEWVMRDGSIAKTEYTKPAKTKTINQQLSENMWRSLQRRLKKLSPLTSRQTSNHSSGTTHDTKLLAHKVR